MKKCLYCSKDLTDDSVIDFCENCGKQAFGEKIFNVIIKNMKEAKEKGDIS